MIIKDFWELIGKFPEIKNLSDLTKIITTMDDELKVKYPDAWACLTEFESSIRSHLWTEWHAQEFYHDVDSTYAA